MSPTFPAAANTNATEADAPQASTALTGPHYWRSLDELLDTPGFQDWAEREFPQGASELDGVNRRQFMKLMAASFALAGAGMSGCRRPESHILPYIEQPERIIQGLPTYYASAWSFGPEAVPIVVETHQARPTKIEGNHRYEALGGNSSLPLQASILDLYDPDRSTASSRGTATVNPAAVRDLLSGLPQKYADNGGQGLAILAEPHASRTRSRLLAQMREALPQMRYVEYGAGQYPHRTQGLERMFGQRVRPVYHFAKARRVLALDSDFVNEGPDHLRHARDFAKARRVIKAKDAGKMNRLYSVESRFSLTGGMADHRKRIDAGQIPAFVALVGAAMLEQAGMEPGLARQLRQKAGDVDVDPTWVEECVADLLAHKGEAIVVAGEHLAPEMHALVAGMNEILEAQGPSGTVTYHEEPRAAAQDIRELAAAMDNGEVDDLVILGGNPAYDAPGDLDFAAKIKALAARDGGQVIRYGYHYDETSVVANLHIAATHYLESWDDGMAWDGTAFPVQPMIMPLFPACFSAVEVTALLANNGETDAYTLVYQTLEASFAASDDPKHAFNGFLHDGMLADTTLPVVRATANLGQAAAMIRDLEITGSAASTRSLDVQIFADHSVGDGRGNNNGWLQECPDPTTKLTWDNAIHISPRLAKELGFDPKSGTLMRISAKRTATFKRGREMAPVAELTVNGVTVRGPVQIQPGLANYTVVVHLGYGRRKVGRIGQGTGFDAYPLYRGATPATQQGASLTITDDDYAMANTQSHWSMEGRAIIREANVESYEKNPKFVEKMGMEAHSPPIYGAAKYMPLEEKVTKTPRGNSLFDHPDFTYPQQWGMTIDLNTCIGCNACMVACQAENNIPIVGKDETMRGREMHWIRIDRYYASGHNDENAHEIPEDPQVALMPMACVHCERAPCEQVCPVNATVHDDQGLNVMAYNRCVGTRYCANNCPYKVRRFNFFDWNKRHIDHFYEGPLGPEGMPELHKLQKNPDVTIRMRGVIEKCTYCVQRIEAAKIAAKVKAKDSADYLVPDGVIKVACQQACPTDAIVFGDLLDDDSEVRKFKASDRDYSVLGYLNTRPRTTYLAKLRNPNPKMPDYYDMPLTRAEYENKFGHGAKGDHGDDHGHTHENGDDHHG